MSTIDADGMLVNSKVLLRRATTIEHGELTGVSAIVVHQTDSSSAESTLNGYRSGGNGAHFLIDRDGQIHQTASLRKRCFHVGRLIRSKCLAIDKRSCDTAAMAKVLALSWARQIAELDAHERAKSYPDRYPVNSDSVGIERVGKHIDDENYEAVTAAQNASLQWLVGELYAQFSLTARDVYRHPDVSYKNAGEARTAQWQ